MRASIRARSAAALASIPALLMVAGAGLADAQPAPGYDHGDGYANQGPPPPQDGQPPQDQYAPPSGGPGGYDGVPPQQGYAPPPQQGYAQPQGGYGPPPPNGYAQGGAPAGASAAYAEQWRQYNIAYGAYLAAYRNWAIQNCVNQHANNTAAGAVVGGVFGALAGAAIAGPGGAGAGAAIGGAVGVGTGAAIGASSGPVCPGGYVVRTGAPAFYYGGPVYAPPVAYAAPYRPWVWVGGRWVYRPYAYRRPYYGPRPVPAPYYR